MSGRSPYFTSMEPLSVQGDDNDNVGGDDEISNYYGGDSNADDAVAPGIQKSFTRISM